MWPGGMREAIKSTAPVAGVWKSCPKLRPKFGRLALPYPPTDVAHCAGHPPSETGSGFLILFSVFFGPTFELEF